MNYAFPAPNLKRADWLVSEVRLNANYWGIASIADLERAALYIEKRLGALKLASLVQPLIGDGGVMVLRIGDEDAHPMCSEWVRRAVDPLMAGGLMVEVRQTKRTDVPGMRRTGQ